jgi:hypothetical protein
MRLPCLRIYRSCLTYYPAHCGVSHPLKWGLEACPPNRAFECSAEMALPMISSRGGAHALGHGALPRSIVRSILLHPDCAEARRLLDAYLMALTVANSARTGKTHENLLLARRRYRVHVNRHGCRKTPDVSDGAVENEPGP